MFKHINVTTFEKIVAIIFLLFAIIYNLWLYRLEPTAKIDPNDNPFQYALVHRTNQIWDFAVEECPKNPLFPLCVAGYLVDHPVPNWAQGYSLPYYYSHIPQISIVASYKLLSVTRLLPVIIQPITHQVIPTGSYQTDLFAYYHVVIYLLLCIFPLSVFMALRVLRLPWIAIGLGALLSTHISTDGLYGLDPSSFLWRGYGLSSQLFSMIWIPMAIAFSLRFFQSNMHQPLSFSHILKFKELIKHTLLLFRSRFFLPAVLFLTLSTMGHLGLGLITMLSVGVLSISPTLMRVFEKQHRSEIITAFIDQLYKLFLISGSSILVLSYWIIPVFLHDGYHNISFWDPVWKFNSYGWKDVVTLFLDGDLFDFGRFPVFSILLIIGGFAVFFLSKRFFQQTSLVRETSDTVKNQLFVPLSFLFLFWFVMFFGRTTWGGIIDLIPGMKEFHQSRFIVGLHVASFFLIPFGFLWLVEQIQTIFQKAITLIQTSAQLMTEEVTKDTPKNSSSERNNPLLFSILSIICAVGIVIISYPQTYRYSQHNDFLIKRGNDSFVRQNADMETLISTLRSLPPGRVFTGRGGGWGKNLEIAETTYFIHLSTYGIPVILWLPETWSPNSDVEQFFIEDWYEHYDLMNVRYVVTTKDIEAKPFWKKINETPSWDLYEASTSGYFTTGSQAAVVYTQKQHFINVVRLWMQSDNVKKKIYPQLTYNYNEMVQSPYPAFSMVDEATYKLRDNSEFSLFQTNPTYEAPEVSVTISGEEINTDVVFKTSVTTGDTCKTCLVILKQTFHPNWKAYINGKKAETITVFPFYIGVPLPSNTQATIEIRYEPSRLKIFLLVIGIVSAVGLLALHYYPRSKKKT